MHQCAGEWPLPFQCHPSHPSTQQPADGTGLVGIIRNNISENKTQEKKTYREGGSRWRERRRELMYEPIILQLLTNRWGIIITWPIISEASRLCCCVRGPPVDSGISSPQQHRAARCVFNWRPQRTAIADFPSSFVWVRSRRRRSTNLPPPLQLPHDEKSIEVIKRAI